MKVKDLSSAFEKESSRACWRLLGRGCFLLVTMLGDDGNWRSVEVL